MHHTADKKEVMVKAEIPGVEIDDLDISLDSRTLFLKNE